MSSNYEYINSLLQKIGRTKGTNAKKELLKEGLNSEYKEDLELVLKHLYDPQIITGVSKKKFANADGDMPLNLEWWTIKNFLNFIHTNNSGKLDDVEAYKSLYNLREEKFLIYSLITKDINIGISRGIVEKFVKIPKFEIMLGTHPSFDDIDWNRQYILTLKMDGVNLTCFKEDNKISFFTRQGKRVEGLNQLKEEYKLLPNGVYFGEAIYDTSQPTKREELFRLTTSEMSAKKDNKKIVHYVFDYVTLEEWNSNKFTHTYQQTFFSLEKTIESIHLPTQDPKVRIIPFIYMGTGKEEALKKLNEIKSQDYEGLVLRYCSSTYQKKRSDDFIKLKPFQEEDLKIIDYKPYKHPNLLGAFIVDYKGNPVSVGSGFSLEQREDFWNRRNEMIGKTIEVQYMDVTKDKSGKESLRFPVFLRERPDKDEL